MCLIFCKKDELGCKPASKDESAMVDKIQYQRLGMLIYLAHTRPDLGYIVSIVSQLMRDPRAKHYGL
jgi:hypothetical protein